MAALDFPNSPTTGQIFYSSTGVPWQWDGTKWVNPASAPVGGAWSTGDAKLTYKNVADPGWILLNDGSIGDALSGATTRANADTTNLFALFWNNISRTVALTCTITIASPGVITATGHTFYVNQKVVFSTSGTLPTGITAGTSYYIINSGYALGSTFQISATIGGAAINTSGTQSGTQTVTGTFALAIQNSSGTPIARGASAAADFAAHNRIVVPIMLGRALVIGGGGSGLTARYLGENAGAETETPTIAKTAQHNHPPLPGYGIVQYPGSGLAISQVGSYFYCDSTSSTGNTGSGSALNIMQPSSFLNIMVCL